MSVDQVKFMNKITIHSWWTAVLMWTQQSISADQALETVDTVAELLNVWGGGGKEKLAQ